MVGSRDPRCGNRARHTSDRGTGPGQTAHGHPGAQALIGGYRRRSGAHGKPWSGGGGEDRRRGRVRHRPRIRPDRRPAGRAVALAPEVRMSARNLGTQGREASGPRSQNWFGAEGKTGFMHRSWLRSEGLPDDSFHGRPVIGIANSWSELTSCNIHLRALAEHVKRGIWQAGGVPFEFPTTSAGEPLVRPTAMLLRNLIAMDLEETLRANPLDGVILRAGCNKTTPAYLMGAASVNLPSLLITGGPMLNGKYRGGDIGSGTSVWRFTEAYRAGNIGEEEVTEAEGCMARSQGHCMTMGTASTLACISEYMGMQLPGTAALPANDSRRA